ncbi:MAG TPA: hypothetical protein DCE41_37745 [Cytophagales bacterium]|nr:hypothetical protein [Cytophagales bacterium]HAA22364.1 hypothetical protein [Cytophagales bacterium]HAP62187.1 hypothetical protein [Cytophagales bacterium]
MELLLIILFLALLVILIMVIVQFHDRNKDNQSPNKNGDTKDSNSAKNSLSHDIVGVESLTNVIAFVLVLTGIGAIGGLTFFPSEIGYLQKPSFGVFFLFVGLALVLSFLGNDEKTKPHIILLFIAVGWSGVVLWETLSQLLSKEFSASNQHVLLQTGAFIFAVFIPFLFFVRYFKFDLFHKKTQKWLPAGIATLSGLYGVWAIGCTFSFFEQIKP